MTQHLSLREWHLVMELAEHLEMDEATALRTAGNYADMHEVDLRAALEQLVEAYE